MKNAILFFLGCALVAGAIVYVNRSKPAPPPTVATTDNSTARAALVPVATAPPATVPTLPATTNPPAPAPDTTTPVPAKSEADIAFGKLMDKLISTYISGADKHALFEQLRKDHQLDQAIAALQQRAAADPTNPEIPTTIGEAMLNKLRDLHDSGDTDTSDLGILAMQADQNFNAALKIDPSNYEAQLVKSISMTYWPADPTRDAQVVQTLTGLIDQQESMTPDPGFAQTYIYLGNEYQKIGQPDKAAATWQLGLAKFPNDPTLQQKLNGL